jgi:hypothetical protein
MKYWETKRENAVSPTSSSIMRARRIEPFMTITRPDPLTRDEQVNEFQPVSRLD